MSVKRIGIQVCFLTLLLSFNIGNTAYAQQSVNGIVTDGQSGETLPGVNILVKGTTTGTSTDSLGNYELNVPLSKDTLVVSYVGYQAQQVSIQGRTTINIALKTQTISGQEMVVVGMTEQQKQLITSSVSSIDISSNIEGKPITQLSQALQGGVTGLTVQQGSGLPGGGAANIKIRGISTLGNTSPLILVDGVPYDLNDVDPANVKDVTVLKDAAAASMYGSRGANGVILVNTKRGIAGKIHVTYNAYGGIQKPTYMPEFVGAPTYMMMVNQARMNIGKNKKYTDEEIKITRKGSDPLHYPNTDWQKNILEPTASIMNHSLSISGGSRRARFDVTASYLDQKGIMKYTKYNKFMLRANTGATLRKNIGMKLDLSIVRGDQEQPYADGRGGASHILFLTYAIPPTIVPKYPAKKNQPIFYSNYAGEMRNPRAGLDVGGYLHNYNDKIMVNFRPHWDIKPNLTLKLQYNYQMSAGRQTNHRDPYNFIDYFTGNLVYNYDNRTGSSITGKTSYNFLQSTLNYKFNIGENKASVLGGISQQYSSPNTIDVRTLRSAFGQLHYSYAGKYLLSASLRFDGSSRFGPGHKWGHFPSVALGWNISNEEFMKPLKFLKQWKVRASYGLLGNNKNVGYYAYQSTINSSNGTQNRFGNPNISWETVKMLDLGTDINLFSNSAVQLTVDWYNKITDDILLSPPVPGASGRGITPINAGKVKNRGWEFKLDFNHNITKKLNLFGKIGFSTYKNTILELPGGPYYPGNQIHKKDYPLGMYYGYETDGLLQPLDIKNQVPTFEGEQAGNIKYIDVNKDGVINSQDQSIIGNPNPRTNYFIDLGFKYKEFDFEALINGYSNNTAVLSGQLAAPLNVAAPGSKPLSGQTDYWRPDNKNARYPRLVPDGLTSSDVTRFSDFWFEQAAYARIKYIQLGYNLNPNLLQRLNLDKFRFYINIKNPFTFTDYDYLDPESQSTVQTYPLMQVYTFGVQVKI